MARVGAWGALGGSSGAQEPTCGAALFLGCDLWAGAKPGCHWALPFSSFTSMATLSSSHKLLFILALSLADAQLTLSPGTCGPGQRQGSRLAGG